MNFPKTERKKLTEVIHGHKIHDDYRWLEDMNSPKVQKWAKEQNKYTEAHIDKQLMKQFEKEIRKSSSYKRVNLPYMRGEYYFWTEREPDQDQEVLYVKKGINGKRNLLMDMNDVSKKAGEPISLNYWIPSPKGKYLAYGISRGGDEVVELRVIEVGSVTEKAVKVATTASWISLAWTEDEKSFYFVAHPDAGSVPESDIHFDAKVKYHKIGTSASEDKIIFGDNRDREEMYSLSLSPDDKTLIISVAKGWNRNDLYLYKTETGEVTDLIVGYEALSYIMLTRNKAFMQTTYDNDNGAIFTANMDSLPSEIKNWSKIIDFVDAQLSSFSITKSKLLVTTRRNVSEKLSVYDYDGNKIEEIEVPDHAMVSSVSSNLETDEFFYSVTTFVKPGVAKRYDPSSKNYKEYFHLESGVNSEDYVVKQEWFVSKDKVKVPVFIVHKKDIQMNGENPAILYGYGGFNNSLLPHFVSGHIPWLERGGIYAVVNARGGGEFGESWHQEGIKDKKQNTYDDFIAAAEHLIEVGYTSKQNLAIEGASNGGLTVCAVAMQRPDLFRAVVVLVPLTDMVRYHKLLMGAYWKSDYGDPTIKEDLNYIIKYSPYHNVDRDAQYPAMYIETALNDSRVHPMHAFKMTAALQATKTKNEVLLHTDVDLGHGGAITMSEYYAKQARRLAFVVEQTGLLKYITPK